MTIVGEAFIPVRALTDEFVKKVKGDTSTATKEAGAEAAKLVSRTSAVIAGIAVDASRSYKAGTNEIVRLTGATGEELEDLLGTMRQVGKEDDLRSGLDSIGEVVARLNQRLGLTGDDLEAVTEQVTRFAEQTEADVGSTVTTAIDLFQKWNVPTERQAELLDYLYAASQRAGTGADALASSVVGGKRGLDALGLSLEDSIAFLAQIEAEGGNADKVLAALSTGWARLAANTKDPERALERVSKRIREASTDTEALQIAIEAFGARSGPVLASIFRGDALDIDGFNADLGETSGRLEDVSERTLTLWDRFGILRRQVASSIGPIADELAVVATIVSGIGPAAGGLKAVAGGFRNIRTEISAVKAAAAAGGSSMSTAGAAAQVLTSGVRGVGLAGLGAVVGLGTLVTFLNARHHAAVAQAEADVDNLVSTLRSAADEGPAAARRLAEDLQQAADIGVRGGIENLREELDSLSDEAKIDLVKEGLADDTELRRQLDHVRALRQEARGLTGERREQVLAEAELVRATRQAAISAALYGENSRQAGIQEQTRQAALDALIAAYAGSERGERGLAGATEEGGAAAEDAAKSERELARERRDRADATREARDAELEAAGGVLGLIGAIYQQRDARRDLAAAEAEVNRLRTRGKTGTEDFADAERELRDARLNALEAAKGTKDAAVDLSDSVRDSVANYSEAEKRIGRWARQMGLSAPEVRSLTREAVELARGVDEVPEEKDIRVEAPGIDPVKRDVQELDGALARLPRLKTVTFQANGLDAILAAARAVNEAVSGVGAVVGGSAPSGGGGSGGGGGRSGGRRAPVPAQAQRSVINIGIGGREIAQEIEVGAGENRILLGGLRSA